MTCACCSDGPRVQWVEKRGGGGQGKESWSKKKKQGKVQRKRDAQFVTIEYIIDWIQQCQKFLRHLTISPTCIITINKYSVQNILRIR